MAGAITSTARQIGAALGTAHADGLVADTGPAGLAHASRPGRLLVAACGVVVLLVTGAARPKPPARNRLPGTASPARTR
ncbi:hypothetical protein [Streptomyces cinerochromogenes]|uniref:hypothetical protein n=1 Tax=Streptomyces cinerochromogenes TaxID=66422 RepID=UPI001670D2F6|nr:hypothetical protein [Streptomyces cinerochromogenes]GGS53762.1 hypothetical protein GCM10010206_14310 [Streptomyces cinerochromogenes]